MLCIDGNESYWSNYPPAAVSLLVSGILQCLFVAGQFIFSKRKFFSARNIIFSNIIFLCWTLGAAIAATVLRKHNRYCPPGFPGRSGECAGRLRGTYGMAYALVGMNFIYIFIMLGLVRECAANLSTPYGYLPDKRPAHNPDMEKEGYPA